MNEEQIFLAAVEIVDPTARRTYLERACGDDAELRSRVVSLLSAHQEAGSFLDMPILLESPTAGDRDTGPMDATVRSGGPEGPAAEEDDATQIVLQHLQPSSRAGSLGRLGHYEVLQILGRGAFGMVFKALDDKLQRIVAIKIMSPELAATSPARKRFLREARASAAIRHENVVGIHAVEEQPIPYLVMEYVPGGTLQDSLNGKGPFTIAEVVRIGRQIASGLAAAHSQGLVHRDIKPGNLLLEEGVEPRVKITDFGLARAVDDASLTQSGVIAGTPMYMAPEQAQGQSVDARADLFSLGSVLYALYTGRPPFRAPTMLAVLRRVVEEAPRPIQEIIPEAPADFCELMQRLQAKRPEDRIQTANEVSRLLGEIRPDVRIAPLPTVDFPKSLAPKTPSRREPAGRPQVGRWLIGGAAVLMLLAAAIFWPRGPKSPKIEEGPGKAFASAGAADGFPATSTPNEALQTPAAPSLLVGRFRQRWPAMADWPPGEPLAPGTLVPRPAPVGGIQSWTLETPYHRGQIITCRFSPDGALIATAGEDATIRLWSAADQKLVGVLLGHEAVVRSLDWSKDGSVLLSAGGSEFCVWDIPRQRLLRSTTIEAEPWMKDCPTYAVWGAEDDVVVTWQVRGNVLDPRLRWWDLATGKPFRTFDFPQRGDSWGRGPLLTRSDDSQRLAIAAGGLPVRVFEGGSGREVLTLSHTDELRSIALSADGARLAAGNEQGRVTVWNAKDGAVLTTLEPDRHTQPSTDLRLSEDGAQAFGLHLGTKTLTVWEVSTGKRLVGPDTSQLLPTCFDRANATGLLVTADASASDAMALVDSVSGRLRGAIAGGAFRQLRGMDWHPRELTMAIGLSDSQIAVHELIVADLSADAAAADRVKTPIDWLFLSWSKDARWLMNSTCRVWDLTQKRLENFRDFQPENHESSYLYLRDWSPDGKLLAVGRKTVMGDRAELQIRELPNGNLVREFPDHVLRGGLAFSPDGRELAFVGHERDATDPLEWKLLIAEVATGAVVRSVGISRENSTVVAWAPDGRHIAVSWVWGVSICEAESLKHVKFLDYNQGGAGSSESVLWLDAYHLACSIRGGAYRVGDIRAMANPIDHVAPLWMLTDRAYGRSHDCLLSADGHYLAVGVRDLGAMVTIWDWRKRQQVLAVVLAGNAERLVPLTISADGHVRSLDGPDAQQDIPKDMIVVYQTQTERSWLPLSEFERRYGWKNDPSRAHLPSNPKPAPSPIDYVAERSAAEELIELRKHRQLAMSVWLRSATSGVEVELSPSSEALPADSFIVSGITCMAGGLKDEDFAKIARCRHLEQLRVTYCPEVTDAGLSQLRPFGKLKILELVGCRQLGNEVSTLIAANPNLLDVKVLWHGPASGVAEAILRCRQLRSLHVSADDLPPSTHTALVEHCPDLRTLFVDEGHTTDLSVLVPLPHLSKLSITGEQLSTARRERTLAALLAMPALETLNCCPPMSDASLAMLTPLDKKLRHLEVSSYTQWDPGVTEPGWRVIEEFQSLESLSIRGENHKIDGRALMWMAKLPSLRTLSVDLNYKKNWGCTKADVDEFHKQRPDIDLFIQIEHELIYPPAMGR